MFASLKNKIREEIGSDVSSVVKIAESVRGMNPRNLNQTGSSSSISESQMSLDESKDQQQQLRRENSFELKLVDGVQLTTKDIKRLENREEEWKKRLKKQEQLIQKKLDKKDEEWKVKMQEKDKEWIKLVEKQEKEKVKLEEGRLKSEKAKNLLEIALKDAEEYKKKLYSFQEDAEQLEGFQSQEMAKIKHLLLAKEQEVEEKSQNLKAALSEIDSLKTEVNRLRRYEEELINIQDLMESLRHVTQREKAQLSSELAQSQEEVRHLKVKVSVLEERLSLESDDKSVDDRIADLMRERTLLERKLEETHLHLSDIKTSWSGKISSLETQVGRLSRQAGEESLERRRVEEEKEKLKLRVKQLEGEIEVNSVVIATKDAKLLRMTDDIDEMATELKELRASVDDEVDEFQRQIESSSKEINRLKNELDECNSKLSTAIAELSQLRMSNEEEKDNNSSLHMQLIRLKENLEIEKSSSATLKLTLEKERDEKDSALLRNAQISQNYELAQQENRRHELENSELHGRIEDMEETLKKMTKEKEQSAEVLKDIKKQLAEFERIEYERKSSENLEKTLRSNLADLEDQLTEKTKTIKVLQQRLADMKKTLHRELKVPSSSLESDVEPAILTPSSSKTVVNKNYNYQDDDVNFKYLKHVLIKFLTSREYEALHLTRAVATLLHFSPEEERLLQETLEWKMSWFGSKPNLGFGQTAKAIPPS